MNSSTLGNTSLLPGDNTLNTDLQIIPNIVSPILRLPVNIYILQLIISRHWITSEFCTFEEAIFELIICFHDSLGIAAFLFQNTYLLTTKHFFLGFVVTGRPFLLALICVERYLAVVKPVVYLRFKPLKYKLVLSGILWLWTLFSCFGRFIKNSISNHGVVVQIMLCCVVKLYCCISTLLVLKQPGPGEAIRPREGISNIKLRAFKILLIITASVILVYVPMAVVVLLKHYMEERLFMSIIGVCYTGTAICSFIQGGLFLQRVGKLTFIKCL